MAYKINGVEIAPCIVAKAKYALGLTGRRPTNTKWCSVEYFTKVVLDLAHKHHLTSLDIQKAVDKKYLYRRNRR